MRQSSPHRSVAARRWCRTDARAEERSVRDCRERQSARGFWSLGLLWNVLWPGLESPFCALSVAMDLDDCCIDNGVFHVRFIRTGLEKPHENVGFDPVAVSLEHRVPLAEQGWKVTPRAACPNDPQHRLNEQPIVASASPGIRALSQALRLHLRPLGVGHYESLHPELES